MVSQGKVVCTFTVTVTLVCPGAIVGGTKDKESLIIQNNYIYMHTHSPHTYIERELNCQNTFT